MTDKTLSNTPLNLIVGRIHQAYTVATDELFMRGYMTQDERKAVGNLIGDLLGNFRDGLMKDIPSLETTQVDPEDVGKIVELFTMKQDNSIKAIIESILAPFTTTKAGARHSKTDQQKLQAVHDHSVDLGASCPMSVFKQADGKYRWVLISSTAFEDKDGEIVSVKAQEQDTNAMSAKNDYGVLRWWHMGKPYATKENDWHSWTAGKGLDLGICDFSAMHGRVRIESGTFNSNQIGERFKEVADQLSVSIGFSHPETEPDRGGVFENIHTFERSLLPRGKQSNYFVSIPVIEKESNMDTTKLDKFKELMGDMAGLVLNKADVTDKAAEESGATFKAEEVKTEVTEKAMTCPDCGASVGASAKYCADCGASLKGAKKEASQKEVDMLASLETLQTSLKQLQGNDEKIAAALSTLASVSKQNAEAIKGLTGELPKSLASLKRSNADDNVIDPTKANETLKQIANPASQFDFFSWAATGAGQSGVPAA